MARKQRAPHRFPTLVDIIDRVLDKGIVIEYHARVSIGGIDTLVTVDARYVAASFDTHLRYAESLRTIPPRSYLASSPEQLRSRGARAPVAS